MTKCSSFVGVAILLFAVFCCGCSGLGDSPAGGGGSTPPTQATPANIAAKWQIIGTSTQNPGQNFPYAGIEATLSQTTSSVSSSTLATAVIPFYVQGTTYSIASGDACGSYSATLGGTVTGQSVTFTLTEGSGTNTYVVSGTATISGDGQTMSGTYTATAGCGVAGDAGTFTGNIVPPLSGTYAASFDTGATPTLTVTEDSSHNVTVTASYQASTYSLTGEAVGGALEVSGDVPTIGTTSYVGFYMGANLVSLVPTVNGNSTKIGDILIFGSDSSIGLAQKQ